MRRFAGILFRVGIACAAAVCASAGDRGYPRFFFQKGVNFTAEFPGGYPSADARRMLGGLPGYGVNAVALVPYGFARPAANGGGPGEGKRNGPRLSLGGGMESDAGVESMARIAHSLGMKVLLKPQIWVGDGRYPGDLDFPSATERSQWFASYRIFIEHYARLAARIHADLFSIGVEFAKLVRYDAEWRKLIARVRRLYPGPLVYAANCGPEFENLTFWGDLDYIGLNEYYPLPDDLSTAAVVQKVEAVQRKYKRPVIFTEAGFSAFERPNREPWDEAPRQLAPADQARCYEAIFRAFYRRPWFYGMYWWKVGTAGGGGALDGSHTPWRKPAMEIIKRWYAAER